MATDDELKAIADSALENSIENQSLTISPGSKSVSRTPARDSFAIRQLLLNGASRAAGTRRSRKIIFGGP